MHCPIVRGLVTRLGDHGAHGDFDDRAHAHSLELWMATYPKLSAVAVALGFTGLGLAYLLRGRSLAPALPLRRREQTPSSWN